MIDETQSNENGWSGAAIPYTTLSPYDRRSVVWDSQASWMGRRRRAPDSISETEGSDESPRRSPALHSQPPLSKYSLIFSGILIFVLFIYAKYRSYNKYHSKESLHRINKKQQSSYQLLEPEENEYHVNVLMTGSSVSGMRYGFAEISRRQYQLAIDNYLKIHEEEIQKQQLYLLLSCRLTSEAHYLPNELPGSVKVRQTMATMDSSSLHHNLSSLLLYISPNQIFDETIPTFDQDLLSAFLPLMKLLDSLRERLSKSSSSRGANPLIHLTIYTTGFHSSIIQFLLQTYLSWSPGLEALVESPVHLEVISTEGIPWSSQSLFESIISSESEGRQKKEVEEIMRWNKIKSIAALERYLILGGKKKIKYL
jgi:hypothetical protein